MIRSAFWTLSLSIGILMLAITIAVAPYSRARNTGPLAFVPGIVQKELRNRFGFGSGCGFRAREDHSTLVPPIRTSTSTRIQTPFKPRSASNPEKSGGCFGPHDSTSTSPSISVSTLKEASSCPENPIPEHQKAMASPSATSSAIKDSAPGSDPAPELPKLSAADFRAYNRLAVMMEAYVSFFHSLSWVAISSRPCGPLRGHLTWHGSLRSLMNSPR